MSDRDAFEESLPGLTLLDQDSTGKYVEEHVEFAWQMWQRISELESALRTIQREAFEVDRYVFDLASEALGDE